MPDTENPMSGKTRESDLVTSYASERYGATYTQRRGAAPAVSACSMAISATLALPAPAATLTILDSLDESSPSLTALSCGGHISDMDAPSGTGPSSPLASSTR